MSTNVCFQPARLPRASESSLSIESHIRAHQRPSRAEPQLLENIFMISNELKTKTRSRKAEISILTLHDQLKVKEEMKMNTISDTVTDSCWFDCVTKFSQNKICQSQPPIKPSHNLACRCCCLCHRLFHRNANQLKRLESSSSRRWKLKSKRPARRRNERCQLTSFTLN